MFYPNCVFESLSSYYCYYYITHTISIPSMCGGSEGKVKSSSGKLAFMYWKPLIKDCHSPATDILQTKQLFENFKTKQQKKACDMLV